MKNYLLANLKLKAWIVCLLFFGFGVVQAQTQVKGVVTSEGEPLPGASVVVKGTSNGTVTDFDGNYEIKANVGDNLVFSYIGYKDKQIVIEGDNSTINVVLEADVAALEEVVVVGYGVQKKKEVTGAVAQVKAESIENIATSDLGTALQGQIAGVTVVASSGAPGAEANVQIRGLTSVFGGNSPLYVVDGVPFNGDPRLSMSEIETIDVLKDAASAAIYGTRGAAGVILITTKKGKEGKMNISLNSYYGTQNITSGIPTLDKEDGLYRLFLTSNAQNGSVYGNTWTVIERSPHQLTNNTSLVDVIENDNAVIQNHSLNVSGGREGLAYSVNANFYNQEGSIINSGLERFNVRANTQYNKGKWKLDTGISFRIEEQEHAPWGITKEVISYSPLQPAIDPNVTERSDAGDGSGAANLSNLGYRLIQRDNAENQYFDGNLGISYDITDNLNFTSRGSLSADNGTRRRINPQYIVFDDEGKQIATQRSLIYNESYLDKKTTWEQILNYHKEFGNHSVNLTGVYSAEKYTYSQFWGQRANIFNNNITVLNGGTSDPNAGSGNSRWTEDRVTTFNGMLGRLQYNYKEKYLLSVSVRRDGSSRFEKEPWGVFPSMSMGWNVSDEKFWKYLENTVSSFKLRASRGTTGNSAIADYGFAPIITLENDVVFGSDNDENLQLGAVQQAYKNGDLKWETSISTNFGYDISFLDNRLTFSSDVYTTKKKDMLSQVLLPPSQGVNGNDAILIVNVGDMENKGFEMAANYRHDGKFSWNLGITYSENDNVVTRMSDNVKSIYFEDSEISGTDNDTDKVTILREGLEAGAFMLVKTDGVIQTEDELAEYLEEYPTSGAKLGDLKLLDALTEDTDGDGVADAGDGVIDVNDQQYAGSGAPEFEMGLNFSANYKNFDFTTQIYGSFGAEIINGNKAFAYQVGTHRDLKYGWSPANPESEIPIYRGSTTHNNVRGFSDYWLEDGTFVRFRNITLGYSYPKSRLEKIGVSKLRLYVTGQNLITLTKYDGYDPEVGNNGLSTRGIDKGTYPISSQIRVGLQLEF